MNCSFMIWSANKDNIVSTLTKQHSCDYIEVSLVPYGLILDSVLRKRQTIMALSKDDATALREMYNETEAYLGPSKGGNNSKSNRKRARYTSKTISNDVSSTTSLSPQSSRKRRRIKSPPHRGLTLLDRLAAQYANGGCGARIDPKTTMDVERTLVSQSLGTGGNRRSKTKAASKRKMKKKNRIKNSKKKKERRIKSECALKRLKKGLNVPKVSKLERAKTDKMNEDEDDSSNIKKKRRNAKRKRAIDDLSDEESTVSVDGSDCDHRGPESTPSESSYVSSEDDLPIGQRIQVFSSTINRNRELDHSSASNDERQIKRRERNAIADSEIVRRRKSDFPYSNMESGDNLEKVDVREHVNAPAIVSPDARGKTPDCVMPGQSTGSSLEQQVAQKEAQIQQLMAQYEESMARYTTLNTFLQKEALPYRQQLYQRFFNMIAQQYGNQCSQQQIMRMAQHNSERQYLKEHEGWVKEINIARKKCADILEAQKNVNEDLMFLLATSSPRSLYRQYFAMPLDMFKPENAKRAFEQIFSSENVNTATNGHLRSVKKPAMMTKEQCKILQEEMKATAKKEAQRDAQMEICGMYLKTVDPNTVIDTNESVKCFYCKEDPKDMEWEMLLCDFCDSGAAHCSCIDPPYSSVPEDQFGCPQCVKKIMAEHKEEYQKLVDQKIGALERKWKLRKDSLKKRRDQWKAKQKKRNGKGLKKKQNSMNDCKQRDETTNSIANVPSDANVEYHGDANKYHTVSKRSISGQNISASKATDDTTREQEGHQPKVDRIHGRKCNIHDGMSLSSQQFY